MKVLVIDDNPADVDIINEIFNNIGCKYDLMSINNGNDAVKFFRKEDKYQGSTNPNLIILDLNLPGKSGHDILKTMAQLSIHIPTIVYTSSERAKDINKAYKYNANCYVVKPSEFSELNKVLTLLGQFWLQVVRLPNGD